MSVTQVRRETQQEKKQTHAVSVRFRLRTQHQHNTTLCCFLCLHVFCRVDEQSQRFFRHNGHKDNEKNPCHKSRALYRKRDAHNATSHNGIDQIGRRAQQSRFEFTDTPVVFGLLLLLLRHFGVPPTRSALLNDHVFGGARMAAYRARLEKGGFGGCHFLGLVLCDCVVRQSN